MMIENHVDQQRIKTITDRYGGWMSSASRRWGTNCLAVNKFNDTPTYSNVQATSRASIFTRILKVRIWNCRVSASLALWYTSTAIMLGPSLEMKTSFD